MSDNEEWLTARVEKIGLWKGTRSGYFFTTADGKEFFSQGKPPFGVGSIVTFAINKDNRLKEATHAEILKIEDANGEVTRPVPDETAQAFAGAKEALKSAKEIVREAQERYDKKPKHPIDEFFNEYCSFVEKIEGLGFTGDANELWLSYRISCLENKIVDFGLGRA